MILRDNSIVELSNISKTPALTFEINPDELEPLLPEVVATWHTHLHDSANLSADDYFFFLAWPEIFHYILSATEIWCYEVRNGAVVKLDDEEGHLSLWASEEAAS